MNDKERDERRPRLPGICPKPETDACRATWRTLPTIEEGTIRSRMKCGTCGREWLRVNVLEG